VDGIREDTIQYMSRPFIHDLLSALHLQYPKMWMVGEVFDRDPVHTSFFIGGRVGWDGVDTNLDSVFDFPLWQTSLDVFRGLKPMRALRDGLKYDALYPDANRLTTMLSNHDVRRTVSLEKMTLEGAMLHTAFLLSVRGTPQLYYGDEIALEGVDDPDNRRDFPGGFPGDARDAFSQGGRNSREQRMYEWTRDWLRLRREHEALRRGRLIDLAYDEDVYIYARQDKNETLIIAVNRAATPKTISIAAEMIDAVEGARLAPLLGAGETKAVSNGKLAVFMPPKTAVAYEVRKSPVK
jgi:glycosidase